jgi:molecular chaperone HscB
MKVNNPAFYFPYIKKECFVNYFQLFNLDAHFSLDLAELSSIYQTLQKTVHPDRFAHGSAQEQLIAVQKSALINDAYETLKKPLKRAEYLLTHRETAMPSNQASFSDNSFLMHQMELHEMLADIKSANDVAAAFEEVNTTFNEEYQDLFNAMTLALDDNSIENNVQASEQLRKLKFYQKLIVDLERLEEQLLED